MKKTLSPMDAFKAGQAEIGIQPPPVRGQDSHWFKEEKGVVRNTPVSRFTKPAQR